MRAARQAQLRWLLAGLNGLCLLSCGHAGGVPIAQIMRSRAIVVMEQPQEPDFPSPTSNDGFPGEYEAPMR